MSLTPANMKTSNQPQTANTPANTGASPVVAHNCDDEIRKDSWAMSGHRLTGQLWECKCGKMFEHVCDEPEGWWHPVRANTALCDGEKGNDGHH